MRAKQERKELVERLYQLLLAASYFKGEGQKDAVRIHNEQLRAIIAALEAKEFDAP